MMSTSAGPPRSSLPRLWAVLAVSYLLLRVAFDLLARGWIDLRIVTLIEVLLIPLGQALVVSTIAAHRPDRAAPATGG